MPRESFLMLIVYNPRDKTFLGKGGKFQSAEEFLRDPPARMRDVVPPAIEERLRNNPDSTGKMKGDPDGHYECIDNVFYLVEDDPDTGGERKTEICRPCPPGW